MYTLPQSGLHFLSAVVWPHQDHWPSRVADQPLYQHHQVPCSFTGGLWSVERWRVCVFCFLFSLHALVVTALLSRVCPNVYFRLDRRTVQDHRENQWNSTWQWLWCIPMEALWKNKDFLSVGKTVWVRVCLIHSYFFFEEGWCLISSAQLSSPLNFGVRIQKLFLFLRKIKILYLSQQSSDHLGKICFIQLQL